jgi:hypothetical protein
LSPTLKQHLNAAGGPWFEGAIWCDPVESECHLRQGVKASLIEHLQPASREIRESFIRGLNIFHEHAGYGEANDRPGGGHPMIFISVECARLQWVGRDSECVVTFNDVSTQSIDFLSKCGESIGFVSA